MEIIGENKKGLKLVTDLFSGCQIFAEDLLVLPKIAIGNLSKSIHVIIIPFLFFSLNLATSDKKGKNDKNLNISRTKTAC